jgi:HSP20 family molecular chaperone IbpA
MSEKQDVTRQESAAARTRSEPETVLRPPVDIYEDDMGITLHADMPGITRDNLEIRVDNETLLIAGDNAIELPEGMQPLYADVRSTRYRREFGLSGELDTEGIDASLKDGVLTLRIHKRAEVRPRKIEVRTG